MDGKLSTYSFKDVVGSIHSGLLDDYVFTGEGTGSISISKSTERTAHDIAADGSVMVSKIPGNNGTVTIEVQQTSPLNAWLNHWFQTLWNSKTSKWAETTLLIKNSHLGVMHVCSGVSPSKEPDTPYTTQGSRITWQLMCADITTTTTDTSTIITGALSAAASEAASKAAASLI